MQGKCKGKDFHDQYQVDFDREWCVRQLTDRYKAEHRSNPYYQNLAWKKDIDVPAQLTKNPGWFPACVRKKPGSTTENMFDYKDPGFKETVDKKYDDIMTCDEEIRKNTSLTDVNSLNTSAKCKDVTYFYSDDVVQGIKCTDCLTQVTDWMDKVMTEAKDRLDPNKTKTPAKHLDSFANTLELEELKDCCEGKDVKCKGQLVYKTVYFQMKNFHNRVHTFLENFAYFHPKTDPNKNTMYCVGMWHVYYKDASSHPFAAVPTYVTDKNNKTKDEVKKRINMTGFKSPAEDLVTFYNNDVEFDYNKSISEKVDLKEWSKVKGVPVGIYKTEAVNDVNDIEQISVPKNSIVFAIKALIKDDRHPETNIRIYANAHKDALNDKEIHHLTPYSRSQVGWLQFSKCFGDEDNVMTDKIAYALIFPNDKFITEADNYAVIHTINLCASGCDC